MLDGFVHAGGYQALAVESVLCDGRIGTDNNGIGFLDVLCTEVALHADGTVRFNLDAVAQLFGGGLQVLGGHIGMGDTRWARRDGENERRRI